MVFLPTWCFRLKKTKENVFIFHQAERKRCTKTNIYKVWKSFTITGKEKCSLQNKSSSVIIKRLYFPEQTSLWPRVWYSYSICCRWNFSALFAKFLVFKSIFVDLFVCLLFVLNTCPFRLWMAVLFQVWSFITHKLFHTQTKSRKIKESYNPIKSAARFQLHFQDLKK